MIHHERNNICHKHFVWLALVHQKSTSHLPNSISSHNSNLTEILILKLSYVHQRLYHPSSLSFTMTWHHLMFPKQKKNTLENSWRLVSCDPFPGSVCTVCPGTTWRSGCQQVAPHGLPQRGLRRDSAWLSRPRSSPDATLCLVLLCGRLILSAFILVLGGISDVSDKMLLFVGTAHLRISRTSRPNCEFYAGGRDCNLTLQTFIWKNCIKFKCRTTWENALKLSWILQWQHCDILITLSPLVPLNLNRYKNFAFSSYCATTRQIN